ncbi:hypothetical protein QW180_21880 [Vibrio sinaloensis]|nr:hypothetical protein [Vibrio sinaloensis]
MSTPKSVFEVEYDDRRVDIIKEEFDMAIRIWKPQDSSLIGQKKLRSTHLLIVASPDYIQRHGMPKTYNSLSPYPRLATPDLAS